jgi:HAE1 family hydrophobic/amphiphilic exporter-1
MMWLVNLSLKNPVFAVMMISALVGLGVISTDRLGVDLFPDVEFPYVVVTTRLEGASPETIETEVTDIIEESVNTISGIELLRSVSSEGISQVFIQFELSEDGNIKAQDVRDRVQIALSDLPDGVDPPVVEKVDPDAAPIISVMIAGDIPIRDLTRYADDVVKEAIQRLPGVGSVSIVGGRERAIRVEIDANKLQKFGVTTEDVLRAIQSEHVKMPGGRLEINGNSQVFGIRTIAEATTPEEFANIAIAYHENGVTIRVSDVAQVKDGMEDEHSVALLNGLRGVSLEVRKQSGRNTVEVSRVIRDAVQRLSAERPAGVEIIVARDIARFIESSVKDVSVDLMIAMALVVLVTFIFLLNFRSTLIVALAIPTSLVATFFAFYLFDFTINMLTLLALTVAIGLLVDDAIVVVEAITRELEDGASPMEAAREGTRKVGLAVLSGTVATLAVFIPIAFMDGIVGRFFFQYGLAIVFSVTVSLLVAITLTPMLASKLLKKDATPVWLMSIRRFWDAADRKYSSLVIYAVRFRYLVLLLAVGSVYLGGFFASQVPSGFTAKADRSEFMGTVELPLGTGIAESAYQAIRLNDALRSIEHIESVFITVGAGVNGRSNLLELYVTMTPKKSRDVNQFPVMDAARQAIARVLPDATKSAIVEVPWVSGSGTSSFDIDLNLKGADLAEIESYADVVMQEMISSGLFSDVQSSYQSGRPEIQVVINRLSAGDQGVSASSLASTVRIALGGVDAVTFEDQGKRYDVRIRLAEDQRQNIEDLGRLQVRGADGRPVELSSISDVQFVSGAAQIDRVDRSRKISILANAASGISLGEAATKLRGILIVSPPPQSITHSFEGYAKNMAESAVAIGFAILLAVIALYMVLASQFNSFSQPAIIMLTAPLSFSGAFAALYVGGMEVSLFTQIGLVGMMGIVMKNGILLVDRANQLVEQGMSIQEAITTACPERLRPVLMTALSAIFGMIPVAIAASDGAEWRNGLGALLIGGLSSSTLLTLLVVPAAFMIPSDMSTIKRWVFGKWWGQREAPPV